MEELIQKVGITTDRNAKQRLSAQIVSAMPKFLSELGELEKLYHLRLSECIMSEGTKTSGELLIKSTDLYRDYNYKKRMLELAETAIKVLNSYTKD